MQIQNNGKPRVLKVNRQDCTTLESTALFEQLYADQKKQDLIERNARLRLGKKKRDLICPKWKLDKCVRLILKTGRTVVDDVFSAIVEKALAGEVEIGNMSISGLPMADVLEEPVEVKPPKKEKKPRAKREDKADE